MQQQVEFDKKILLILEGNIGAGKSTFLRILENNLDVDIIFEPTDKWQNVGPSGNLLDLFYKDTKRWAYTFQSYAFITRVESVLEHQSKSIDKKVQILERSVYCDRYCFAKNCFEMGNMSAMEWQIYKEWFSWLVEGYMQKPHGFIYLRTSPAVCEKRLRKRDRSEEAGVPLSYLQRLHEKHDDWLVHRKEIVDYLTNLPVLTLDCDPDFESDLNKKKEHVNKVREFINSVGKRGVEESSKPAQIQL